MCNAKTNIRIYIQGITQDGSKEFLVTTLDRRDAEVYVKDHQKIFPGRYVEYKIGTAPEIFN
jgi:hypothetical protein